MKIRPDDNALLHTTRLHEGFRSKPYMDETGHWTIGYGTNLAAGITVDQGECLMRERYKTIITGLMFQEWFNDLSANRQRAIAEMVYQLGWGGAKKFKRMLAAIALKDYKRAADEMMNSQWAQQTFVRAEHCAKLMREG